MRNNLQEPKGLTWFLVFAGSKETKNQVRPQRSTGSKETKNQVRPQRSRPRPQRSLIPSCYNEDI
jgi:hypothetical protein